MFLCRNFYIKTWLLFDNHLINRNVLLGNFGRIAFLVKNGLFLNGEVFFSMLYRLQLILAELKFHRITFVATHLLFHRILEKKKFWQFISKRFVGLFSNFFYVYSKCFNLWNSIFCPSVLIFFQNQYKDQVLIESLKQKIPSIGIFSVKKRCTLYMYTINVQENVFINRLFLIKLLIRMI